MKRRFTVAVFLVMAVARVVFAGEPASGKKSLPKEVSEVGASFAAAVNAKDASKAALLYSKNASLMIPNGEPIRGREGIEAFWKQMVGQGLMVSTTTSEADASGSIGYETGTYELSFTTADGQIIRDKGKYVNLMKREADGHWRMIVDIWNSNEPVTPNK